MRHKLFLLLEPFDHLDEKSLQDITRIVVGLILLLVGIAISFAYIKLEEEKKKRNEILESLSKDIKQD
jgi:hypothetical protein